MTRIALRRTVSIAAGLALFAALSTTAWADKVLYKDGRAPVEGTVLEKNADQVVLQTKFGQITIPMKDVLRIETGKTAAESFKEKWESVDKDNVEDLLALAEWCEESGLSRETKKIYRRVIEVDPNHETARRALGDVLVDGKWVAKKDLEAQEKARKAAEKKEKADADKANKKASTGKKSGGLSNEVKIDASGQVGQFLTPINDNKEEDAKTKQSLEDFFGQKFTVQTCARFSLRAQMPADENQRHLALCEKVLISCNALFGHEPSYVPWNGVYVWFQVKQKGTFQDLIDWLDKNMLELDPETKKFFKDGGGLISAQPTPTSAQLEGGTPLERVMANEVGNTWVTWYTGGGARNWLTEGFGAYTAIMEFGVNELWHSTNTKYAGRTEIASKNSDSHLRLVCHDIIAGATETTHAFGDIFRKKLNDLDYADLAKSWSLVDFLITEHRDQFHEYLQKVRGYPDDETAFREIFGWSINDLESKWKDYVLKTYPKK
jgi:hypothetical protein